ncbi:hypothetical protein ZWY2020_021861 [Hordeum vulgare]|nr:hypothetical protein ZWY2020_021861 [Hordeum vulgare]
MTKGLTSKIEAQKKKKTAAPAQAAAATCCRVGSGISSLHGDEERHLWSWWSKIFVWTPVKVKRLSWLFERRIDKELWPKDESRREIEGLMTRLENVPSRVQAWKKSAARCGADVALSLVRVHCKEAREEKLKALQVANTKKLQFEDFMETFLESATRIADGIDLDTLVEPASPSASPDDA